MLLQPFEEDDQDTGHAVIVDGKILRIAGLMNPGHSPNTLHESVPDVTEKTLSPAQAQIREILEEIVGRIT